MDIDAVLVQTLDDLRVTRTERRALAAVIADLATAGSDLDVVRSRAFATARRALGGARDRAIVDWLEEVVRIIAAARATDRRSTPRCAVYFSPGTACVRRVVSLFDACTGSAEVCVFTITDDRISRAILAAHRRGVAVRIITDDMKAADLGSDIRELESAGIAVEVDHGPSHMHHKFAVFDRRRVATGSYNWTRSAAEENQENLVVSDDPALVRRFTDEFERLWNLWA